MRRACLLALSAALLAAHTAQGQVQLLTKPDGSKLIVNGGPGGSRGGSDYKWLAKQRNRRSQYDAIIDRYSLRYGVDPVLVRAVIQVESNFNPDCVSHKGARGLMQLMPATAKRYGVKRIHDPEENIAGGIRFLAYLLDLFRNDLTRVLAAYNAGENAVRKYGGIPPYRETMTYVRRALTVYHGAPYGQSMGFAGGKPTLKGGFGAAVTQPVTLLPGMRYLGTR